MRIELHGTVHFQQRQIVLKRGRIVLAMDNDALDILGNGTFALQITGDIKLAHDSDQRGQESNEMINDWNISNRFWLGLAQDLPWLTMGGGDDIATGD